MERKHISLTIDSELLAEIERLRGLAKRSTFIEYIIKVGLEAFNEHNKEESGQISPKNKRKRRC